MALKAIICVLLVCLALESLVDAACEDNPGYQYIPCTNMCIRISTATLNTRGQALDDCEADSPDAHLATLDSIEKLDNVAAMLAENPLPFTAEPYGVYIDGKWNSDTLQWEFYNGTRVTGAATYDFWYNPDEFNEDSNEWTASQTRSCIRLMSDTKFKWWTVQQCWNTGDDRFYICQIDM